MFTKTAVAGYIGTTAPSTPAARGGFYGGLLSLYPDPNLALSIGGGQALGRSTGIARAEYLTDLGTRRTAALRAEASAGDQETYGVRGGVRLYLDPTSPSFRVTWKTIPPRVNSPFCYRQ